MLLCQRRQVLRREVQRALRVAAADELYEPLLLQVEEQLRLLVQDLG